jgi:uroporphyrinogen-III synthase
MPKPVLLIRAAGNQGDADALAELGISSVIDPYIQIITATDDSAAKQLLAALHQAELEPTWLVATSVNAIRCFGELVSPSALELAVKTRNLRFAAVGQATAAALTELGASEVLTPETADSSALTDLLLQQPAARVVIPSGRLAMPSLPQRLSAASWQVLQGEVYTTVTVEHIPASAARVLDGQFGAVVFRSPSAARAFLSFVPQPKLPLICAGFTTAKVFEDAGLAVASITSNPTPKSIAAAVALALKEHE